MLLCLNVVLKIQARFPYRVWSCPGHKRSLSCTKLKDFSFRRSLQNYSVFIHSPPQRPLAWFPPRKGETSILDGDERRHRNQKLWKKPWKCQVTRSAEMSEILADDEEPSFDKSSFSSTITLLALRVPKKQCSKYILLLKDKVFSHPKIKAVLGSSTDEHRLILLKESLDDLSDILPQSVLDGMEKDCVEQVSQSIKLDYDHLPVDEVLKKVLPEGWEIPSSFEMVGHIAHLNLRKEYVPYKKIIGQVILDKNPTVKTVVNKTASIENEFRIFPMEVIAGQDNLEATVLQNKAKFRLNFAEVYWNSRLEQEHKRLVSLFQPGEVIADVMAGIGPFAIPAAQQGNRVFANDLNPRSCHYLRENIKLNKVTARVTAYQMDGRDFIKCLGGAASGLQDSAHVAAARYSAGREPREPANSTEGIPPKGVLFHHVIMNLPASAVEFLDAFRGAFCQETWRGQQLPMVHVYLFARSNTSDEEVQQLVEGHLGAGIDPGSLGVRLVRDVAPNKCMFCASFQVPEIVAYQRTLASCSESTRAASQPVVKKPKLVE